MLGNIQCVYTSPQSWLASEHCMCRYRVNELVSSWHSLKATSDAENDLVATEQQKVGDPILRIMFM